MAIMKVLSEKQNLLLQEFCKTFPPVINEKRPIGDIELSVPESILDNEELCRKFISAIWESEGWDSLGATSQMNEFMLFRTAPDVLFVMPFFRNIGYHPYIDKDGVSHNDEPNWWLGDNNYWKKTLRFFKGCDETEQPNDSFCISFRHLDNRSLSQIRDIQVEKMEESFVNDDPKVLLKLTSSSGAWTDLPVMKQINFQVPFHTYSYRKSYLTKHQKLGLIIESNEYTSVEAFTAKEFLESQYRDSNAWMFIAPREPEMKVLNWAALKEDDLREFISVI